MKKIWLGIVTAFAWGGLLTACDNGDFGKACPDTSAAASAPASVPTEDAENDYPATRRNDQVCETFICLSTVTRSNYCSAMCNTNRDCPGGFACSPLQPIGPYSSEKYCILDVPCKTNLDCPQGTFVCRQRPLPDGSTVDYCDLNQPPT